MRPSLTIRDDSRDHLVGLTDLIARHETEADLMQLRLADLGRRIGGHASATPSPGPALA